MKKSELVTLLSGKMNCSKVAVEKTLDQYDTIVEIISEAIEAGDRVKIGKYIAVEKNEVEARTYRNPKTGETIEKEAGFRQVIKATKAFKALA